MALVYSIITNSAGFVMSTSASLDAISESVKFVPPGSTCFSRFSAFMSKKIGLDSFDCIASVPTSGLVIASALSIETIKPLIYVRHKQKDYGTGNVIEGKISEGSRIVLVDDVGTTGLSLLNAIKSLKDAKMMVIAAFVIVNRSEGARELLASENVKLYEITDVQTVSNILYDAKLLDEQTHERIKKQMNLV